MGKHNTHTGNTNLKSIWFTTYTFQTKWRKKNFTELEWLYVNEI